MQADEFEKKIQNKMEGFALVPGGEVWQQVAARIDKEKKKRRILILFVCAGFVLLSATSALLFIKNDIIEKPAIIKINNYLSKKDDRKIKQAVPGFFQGAVKAKKARLAKNTGYLKKDTEKHNFKTKTKNTELTKITKTKIENRKQLVKEEKRYNKVSEEEKPLPSHKFYNPGLAVTANADTAEKNKIANRKTNLNEKSAATAADKEIIKAKSKKIRFGFTIYSGVSNNISGLPLQSLDKIYTPNYPSQLSVPGSVYDYNGGNYNSSTNAFNNFSSSFSFGLGTFVKKQLSAKFTFSTGIDYHFYSAKSTVGNKVNQQRNFYDTLFAMSVSVNRYYASGNSVRYYNNYHLIELPLYLAFQLNKNQKKPFVFSAGVSPGYMFATNALYADSFTDVYYSDRKKFHRFYLSAQMAFLFPLIGSDKYLISAGPVVQYGITKAAKAVTDQHLFFTGIKANITLK